MYANAGKLASRESQAEADMLFFCCFLNLKYGSTGLKVNALIQSLTEKMMVVSVPELGGISFNVTYHLLELGINSSGTETEQNLKVVEGGENSENPNLSSSLSATSGNHAKSIPKIESLFYCPDTNCCELKLSNQQNKTLKIFDLIQCNLVCKKLDLMLEEKVTIRLLI